MLISWNTTRACNQACEHCYRDAGTKQEDELSTAEGLGLIEEIATAGFRIMVFSGGEPLLRDDIFDLMAHAHHCGLRSVLGTNGTLIDTSVAGHLKQVGVARAGISLDSTDEQAHDQFRRMPGAWKQAVEGMRNCQQVGLPFQVHTTLTARNAPVLTDLIDFAESIGAAAHHIFFLVPTGRGKQLESEALDAEQYEQLLDDILEKQRHTTMEIKPTCAPQFMRIAAQKGMDLRFTKGCLAGTTYCVIIPNGDVNPCPYLPVKVGNVRETPFSQLWRESPVFATLRQAQVGGVCGRCKYQAICGGCRARAYYFSDGDFMAEDPWCAYGRTMSH